MRELGKQSIHDHVVRLVAQRWNNPLKYKIAVNPGSEKNRWVGKLSDQSYPDLIGWSGSTTVTRLSGSQKSKLPRQ